MRFIIRLVMLLHRTMDLLRCTTVLLFYQPLVVKLQTVQYQIYNVQGVYLRLRAFVKMSMVFVPIVALMLGRRKEAATF